MSRKSNVLAVFPMSKLRCVHLNFNYFSEKNLQQQRTILSLRKNSKNEVKNCQNSVNQVEMKEVHSCTDADKKNIE